MIWHVSVLHYFLWLSTIALCYILHFVHSSVDGRLGCFYFLAIMNNDAINIHVPVFMLDRCYHYPPFIDEETGLESLDGFPNITQLLKGGIQTMRW